MGINPLKTKSKIKPEGTFSWRGMKLRLSCGCWFEFDAGSYDVFESEMCDKHLKRFN